MSIRRKFGLRSFVYKSIVFLLLIVFAFFLMAIVAEKATHVAEIGAFYTIFILLIPVFFIIKYIFVFLGRQLEFEVEIEAKNRIPAGLLDFMLRTSALENGFRKIERGENIFVSLPLKFLAVLWLVAGNLTIWFVRFYLWLYKQVFGEELNI